MSAARAGGPTDVFTTVFPIIVTHQPGPMLHFYRDLLGAKVGHEFLDASDRLAYVGLRLRDADLGIAVDPALTAPSQRFSLWVYTVDCDQAIASLRAAGVTILAEPTDQPWGERMATVADPDGNVVRVGQPPQVGSAGVPGPRSTFR